MKFPESWLRECVKVEATREELAARLTAIGLEVEEITPVGGDLPGVVVAEILECAPHPEADRLQVCKVSTGAEAVQIVCGAPNARPGLRAPLAMVGSSLPGGIAIKAAKLRGVESFGMLCSAKELGIDADASGLMELPADAPVGRPLAAFLGLPDATFELKLTPNRADCFSVRGIAYDVAAAMGSQVEPLAIAPAAVSTGAALEIRLDAGADCPRYCGRVIEGVDASISTPRRIAERLRRSGIRPVSLLVDVTHYVMLELGQPMHAFDRGALRGPMGVRRARDGDTLKLLDEREVALDAGFLVITDADRAVALAGVMGGWDTRVTEATRDVFLESAHFDPAAVIGRARKLGMHTDASHRFERGVDPELPRLALERATVLILEIAGGQAGPITEAVLPEHLTACSPVLLRRARLARVLGIIVSDAEVERILRALGLDFTVVEQGWLVTPPSRRFDIAIEEDLIEEIVRIHGYDAIPTTAPTGQIGLAMPSETQVGDAMIRRHLVARDYQEAICFAFVDQRLLEAWQCLDGSVALANPLSAELGVMRTALLPGLVETLSRNLARQQTRVRLFELGRVFRAGEQGPVEERRIAAVACGSAAAEQWGEPRREVDFYDLKGEVEALFAGAIALEFEPAEQPWLHPGRSAVIRAHGRPVGWVGHLHPALLKSLDLEREVVAFELNLDSVQAVALPRAIALSRFPSVRRDLALVMPEATQWSDLEATLCGSLGGLLREVRVFDRYVGPGLEAGAKSLAMGLILQDVSRTLTDHEVEQAVAAAAAALEVGHGAKIRG